MAFVLLLCGSGLIGAGVVSSLDGPLPGSGRRRCRRRTPHPQPAVSSAAAEAAWRGWMARHQVSAGTLAIGLGGAVLHSAGEKRSPQTGYPVASLSKAVTGMCLNQLLQDSPYGWDSTLADLAPEFAKVNFTPA